MKKIIWCCICMLMTACQIQIAPPFHVDDYKNHPAIALNVSDISVQSLVSVYHQLPHIETTMPITPQQAMIAWMENRFYADDPFSLVTAEWVIRDAYMTQTLKPSPDWYVLDNVLYKLTYSLDLVFKKEGYIIHTQSVNGWETRSIPVKSSLRAKEQAWQDMMNSMIHKINNQIVPQIPIEFTIK